MRNGSAPHAVPMQKIDAMQRLLSRSFNARMAWFPSPSQILRCHSGAPAIGLADLPASPEPITPGGLCEPPSPPPLSYQLHGLWLPGR